MSGQQRAGDPGGSGWAGIAGEVTAAVARCEEAVATLLASAPGGVGAALEVVAALHALRDRVARLAWDEELARQEADRAYARGLADGRAARRRAAARPGPRPRWPRPAS